MIRIVLFSGVFLACTLSLCAQDSLNVSVVNHLDYSTETMNLALRDNLLYVGVGNIAVNLENDSSGLWIVDVSNPVQPIPLGAVLVAPWGTPIQGLALVGNYAYLALLGDGLEIVDVSNPNAPTHAGGYHWEEFSPISLAAQDTLLCLTQWWPAESLTVMGISDPAHPVELGACAIHGANAVAMSGHDAYVTGSQGVSVVDLSNPRAPQVVGNIASVYGTAITISGNHAYVAGAGLYILDISDPIHPAEAGSVSGARSAFQVGVEGNHAFIAGDYDGLRVVDVSAPSSPYESGYYVPYDAGTCGVAVSGQYAFVSMNSTSDLLYVFDCSAALGAKDHLILHPSSFILSCAPNPFNPSTTISFSLSRASNVKLHVFNVTGRLVQTLTDKRLEEGEHRLSFDGTALASGIYFARLDAGAFRQTQKLMLIK